MKFWGVVNFFQNKRSLKGDSMQKEIMFDPKNQQSQEKVVQKGWGKKME